MAVPAASASRYIQHGIFDDAQINYGDPDKVFPQLKQLNTQLIRVNLVWGGPNGVSKRKPVNPTNPNDPAYDWSVYDRTVFYAQQNGIKVVFAIVGTPPWANGGQGRQRRAQERARPRALRDRCGTALQRHVQDEGGTDPAAGPPVARLERAEQPGLPAAPVQEGQRQDVIQSAIDYAKICNAVVKGVRKTTVGASKVACGVTGPRGNNNPNSARPAVSPLPFLRAMKKAGAKGFDAYAHHPVLRRPSRNAEHASSARDSRQCARLRSRSATSTCSSPR